MNAQKTRIFNDPRAWLLSNGTFGSYVQVDNDQAFLLDGLDTIRWVWVGNWKLRSAVRRDGVQSGGVCAGTLCYDTQRWDG